MKSFMKNKKALVFGVLLCSYSCFSTYAAEMEVAEAVQESDRFENCHEALDILDSLVEQQPAILHLIRLTAYRAGKVIGALEQQTNAQGTFLEEQKKLLISPVQKFLSLVHENGSMLNPVIEAILGEPSEYITTFFEIDKEEADAHFYNIIDSFEKLQGFAQEVKIVCSTLNSEEIFVKGYPAYRIYLEERRKAKKND